MWWFLLLKTVHVLSAIAAVGANLTYGAWSARGGRDAEHLGFVLRGIKFVDDRIANPAYGLLLVTGLLMAFLVYSITTTWILIGLGIFIAMAVGGAAGYGPTLKRQIETLDRDGPKSAAYLAVQSRATGIGMFLGVLAVAAVFVMVFKPAA
ncbi:MAG TPA: DUF2269 family protein [Candidatus Dormibacteraeota bacterium]